MATDMYLVVVTWSTVEKEELSVSGTTTVTMVTTRHIARQPANNKTLIKNTPTLSLLQIVLSGTAIIAMEKSS